MYICIYSKLCDDSRTQITNENKRSGSHCLMVEWPIEAGVSTYLHLYLFVHPNNDMEKSLPCLFRFIFKCMSETAYARMWLLYTLHCGPQGDSVDKTQML